MGLRVEGMIVVLVVVVCCAGLLYVLTRLQANREWREGPNLVARLRQVKSAEPYVSPVQPGRKSTGGWRHDQK